MSDLHFQGKPCKRGHDGLRYLKGSKDCVRCARLIAARWQKDNPERRKAIARRTATTWRKKNPEKHSARSLAWAKSHPSVYAARSARRIAAKLKATPAWADQDKIKAIYKRAAELGMQVDHIVPLISTLVSGLHVEANLQLLPGADNVRKGNRYWPNMP